MSILSYTDKPYCTRKSDIFYVAFFLLLFFSVIDLSQSQVSPQTEQSSPTQLTPDSTAKDLTSPAKLPKSGDRRKAENLFLEASKLFEKKQFDPAMQAFEEAQRLDSSNSNYHLAAELARSHAATALIQDAAKLRLQGKNEETRDTLLRAYRIDPNNPQIGQHLYELAGNLGLYQSNSVLGQPKVVIGGAIELAPSASRQSFHLRSTTNTIIQQVLKAYGIDVFLDDSVHPTSTRLDLDDVNFNQSLAALELATHTFHVPIDARHVLMAADTQSNRHNFERKLYETIYLPGLSDAELTEIGTLAKNIFDIQQAVVDKGSGTISLRSTETNLNAFNLTMEQLLAGHNQVMLEVHLIQVARTNGRNTGLQIPQQITALNLLTEEQNLTNKYQSQIQQLISSGVIPANATPLQILGALYYAGLLSDPLLTQIFKSGAVLVGGGKTATALVPGPVTLNMGVNSSSSQELDQIQLHLQDGEVGTLKLGTRYPIQTSSYSNLGPSLSNIPGLNLPGNSSSLSSLLSSLSGTSVPNIPQVQYEDLGLTMKATPKVLRNNSVNLILDMKIDALSGSSLNGNPILNNRAISGSVTLQEGEIAVVVSDLDKQQSNAVSGTPGLSEIPGLNNITDINNAKNYASLLIVIIPHVIRETQPAGHSPMLHIERTSSSN